MNYTHLIRDERYQIAVLRKAGHLQGDIAKLLDRHTSTIGREVRRNTGLRGYRPNQAHALCVERAVACQNGPRIPQSYSLIARVPFKKAAPVSAALTTLLARYADRVHNSPPTTAKSLPCTR